MKFSNLFTSNVLSGMTSVSFADMILGVLLSLLLGLFIYFIYQKTFCGVLYSSGFGLTLVALCMISAILIMAVSSNIVLSLGMVGALSIVRFRTAIKEPLDIAFLFWSISAGIIIAAGLVPLAVFGSIIIGVCLLVFANTKSKDNPYLIIVHLQTSDHEQNVMDVITKQTKRSMIKGKTFAKDGKEELTVEVQLKNGESAFVKEIHELAGVDDVVMVSYNGDYMQ